MLSAAHHLPYISIYYTLQDVLLFRVQYAQVVCACMMACASCEHQFVDRMFLASHDT
jgi:hypothetical protein